MSHSDLLHQVGVLVAGGTGIYVLRLAPIDDMLKHAGSVVIGLVMVSVMARIAGLV